MALDATPKSTTANAYLTVAEADDYFASRLYSTVWISATSDQKEDALIWATAILDYTMEWEGAIRTTDQRLRWPRSGVVDEDGRNVDYETHPPAVQNATAELALALLTRDRTAEPKLLGQGFSQAKLGSLEVTVDPSQILTLLPRHIMLVLSQYGSLKPGADYGGMQVKLVRT